MRVRGVDGDNDWLFGKGQNDYGQAGAAVAFLIGMRLRSFLGDCFFDLNTGLDWFNLLGAKDQTQLQLAVAAVILNTEGVQSLKEIAVELDRRTRRLTVRYTVTTAYSSVSATFVYDPNAA